MFGRRAAAIAISLAMSCAAFPPLAVASTADLCVKDKPVQVLYAGSWYAAKVLDGPDKMGTCLVSYDGYGANWDEWVSFNRMRPGAGGASSHSPAAPAALDQDQAASTAPVATATAGMVPTGKYSCYTFDAGQLNYSYTDVQILDATRYSVGDKSGRYTLLNSGALQFTGPMANATGKFSIKSGGKPQIDLVFNGDNRALMTCPKAR